ncbi:MAG: hypothetical protein DHS20C21_07410 [Gemmatimonadota bacterium]|nr:MAG: hypothetical protein DHS20C21_07410 [Gemmatimonadota bacterium]
MARASTFILIGPAVLLTVLPSTALQRREVPTTADRDLDNWKAGATCSVSYFNTCTGWIWAWSGWANEDVVGIAYDPCCDGAVLEATSTYVWSGACCVSWGFTGTIEVSTADSDGCPTTLLAQRSFFPASGLNVHTWNAPAVGPVALTITVASKYFANSMVLPSDHPAAGATGPAACGFCYPSDRETHSFYYGNNGTGRNCPGQPLFDGVCNAEWLDWSALFTCPVGIEDSSWGTIKNLYR